MARAIFVTLGGERIEVEAEIGSSLMVAALVHGVEGIAGECGGGLVCGTCHAYVDVAFADKLPPVQDKEDDLLVFASDRRAESRLCCQIVMTGDLDGIVLRLPPSQP